MLRRIVNSGRSIEQGSCSKMLVTDEKSVNRVEKNSQYSIVDVASNKVLVARCL